MIDSIYKVVAGRGVTEMKTIKLLAAGGLILLLGACAITTSEPEVRPAVERDETASVAEPGDKPESESKAESESDKNRLPPVPEALSESPVGMQNCATAQYASKPLARGENEAVFDQFNFRPQDVTVFSDTIAVETAHYTFYYCPADKNWVALSNEKEVSSPEDRWFESDLDAIANPAYQSIEANGKTYKYRTRLVADWLDNQQGTSAAPEADNFESNNSESNNSEDSEEAVYFDLKLPNGEEMSRKLYTVSDVKAAKLGASLGVPNVAGAAIADGKLWFATTSSQGEGDSGFASLVNYDLETDSLSIEQPEKIQGDQITDMVATEKDGELTLWLGTQRMGEGVPFYPASGLVAYKPNSGELKKHTITNSPMVGAIPYALATQKDLLWVATGDGPCRVKWQRIEAAKSWECWRVAPTAQVPKSGVPVYDSFLATDSDAKLANQAVEVLWVAESYDYNREDQIMPESTRYEVVYEPGFEATLAQGGYRVEDVAARRAVAGEPIFWPGRQWHWAGDRFRRGLDEVSSNFVGGGPYGLVSSTAGEELRLDHKAIRGSFDLLKLTPEETKVKYYSGWVDADALEVYPQLKRTKPLKKMQPNPLDKMGSDLPNSGP